MRQTTQLTSGFVVHAFLALLLVCFLRPAPTLAPPDKSPEMLIWTAGFGGGGQGGDGVKAAPAAPVPKPLPAQPQFRIPSTPTASPMVQLPGVVAVLIAADGVGPGTDDGHGRDKSSGGPGTGTERGSGVGPGEGPLPAGTPGVTSPQVILERRPEYTVDAMRAKVQGSVLLEAAVLMDGSVGAVRVIRSLDKQFGLDQKAIEAVRQWRFRPGTHFGKPAAVLVLVELTFTLR